MRGTSITGFVLVIGALLGCATPASNGTSSGEPEIPTTIRKPDGPGPFPAIVVMHDCSGLGPRSSGAPGRWASELIGRGYVVLIPDSFTTRGLPGGVCTEASPRRNDVSPAHRARDAYATLARARTLAYVDATRVGIMGGSHGGSTTLASMLAAEGPRDGAVLRAGVALYPSCAPSGRVWHTPSGVYRPSAPVLILIGEKDDWTPAEACTRLAEAAQKAGYPVSLKIYPGAHHSFDSPNPTRYLGTRINANAPGGRGATTGGDPAAWADAIRQVTAFFAEHLK